MSVQNARSRLESIEEQLTQLSAPTCRILRKITYYVTEDSSVYKGGHLQCVLWEFQQPNTHSEPIEPLIDEIMDFRDIIYRSNNYVKNLHATGNNENKNTIFIHQFYICQQMANKKCRFILGHFLFMFVDFSPNFLRVLS